MHGAKPRLDAWTRLQELKTERAPLVSQRSKGRDLPDDRALIQDGAGAGRLCASAPSADGQPSAGALWTLGIKPDHFSSLKELLRDAF